MCGRLRGPRPRDHVARQIARRAFARDRPVPHRRAADRREGSAPAGDRCSCRAASDPRSSDTRPEGAAPCPRAPSPADRRRPVGRPGRSRRRRRRSLGRHVAARVRDAPIRSVVGDRSRASARRRQPPAAGHRPRGRVRPCPETARAPSRHTRASEARLKTKCPVAVHVAGTNRMKLEQGPHTRQAPRRRRPTAWRR